MPEHGQRLQFLSLQLPPGFYVQMIWGLSSRIKELVQQEQITNYISTYGGHSTLPKAFTAVILFEYCWVSVAFRGPRAVPSLREKTMSSCFPSAIISVMLQCGTEKKTCFLIHEPIIKKIRINKNSYLFC